MRTRGSEPAGERRAWELLTRNFEWEIPEGHAVRLYGDAATTTARVQIFELAVATVMSRIHPDYEWEVTKAGRDSGLDFIGRQLFLDDTALGIKAEITVGGQCKKRSQVKDVVDAIGSSLTRMAVAVNPTYFIVALSARVSPKRIAEGRSDLEHIHHRHCHILDRAQVEGLLVDHVGAVGEILYQALATDEAEDVLRYLAGRSGADQVVGVEVDAPERVLGGLPFSVTVSVRSTLVSQADARLWWVPAIRDDGTPMAVEMIGPIAASAPGGAALAAIGGDDDPLLARFSIEMVSYANGVVELGELLVGRDSDPPGDLPERTSLGSVRVIDNVRPRFFARPVQTAMGRLEDAFGRAQASGVCAAAVVGAGGSGKSRLCEEFVLGRRRHGATAVIASQPKTHDEPHGVLAQLLRGVAEVSADIHDHPADAVVRSIACFDPALAAKVDPTIRTFLGTAGPADGAMVEQDVLSALVVLIVARAQRSPLVVHLEDLHWCTADVLSLLERLLWQLEQVVASGGPGPAQGVLIALEGRVRESGGTEGDTWSSAPFEVFLDRINPVRIACATHNARDASDFVRRLFEQRHSASRSISDDLLPAQDDLIDRVERVAGGNPFHTLAQVQLLRSRGVLGRNRETGLHYLIRPEPDQTDLPESVFEAIRLRWNDIREREPSLALLLWACALLDDRVAESLFRRLWAELAPGVSRRDVDATDILWTGDGRQHEVRFRHENHFHALRSFDVAPDQRARVVEVYEEWFAGSRLAGALDRFRWARALAEAPVPDRRRIRTLLTSALRMAERDGDRSLARRIAAARLDQTWADDARSPVPTARFLAACDDELALLRGLLDVDRPAIDDRLGSLRERISARSLDGRRRSAATAIGLERRRLETDVVYAQYLFNDQQPDRAAEIAAEAGRAIAANRAMDALADPQAWEVLEMEALHAQAVAIAIAGEVRPAVPLSAAAVDIARRLRTKRAHQVIGTHGNILLGVDPESAVALLRECLDDAPADDTGEVDRVEIHLCIGLAILAHRHRSKDIARSRALTEEARGRLGRIVSACFRVGLYADAGAAALMLGIVSELDGDGDAVRWFAQAVAASARGQQLETLWKAHLDLALAVHRAEGQVTQMVHDHARAALDIMERSLASSAHPDLTPRFGLLRTSLAQAVSFLVLAGDEAGPEALVRYPGLRSSFSDPTAGILRVDRGPAGTDHEWTIRIGEADFILY